MNGDIELEVGPGSAAGRFTVRVIRAAAGGEPVGTFTLDVTELLRSRPLLEATVLASAVPRRSIPLAEQPVRQVGRQLFEALFTGPVGGMYRASLGVAQQRGKRLRVVLRLTAPELAALPWETLFDPETDTYLCRREPLVRHVHAPYTEEPLEVRLPLRVLGLVASPEGLQALDVEAEKRNLATALAGPIERGLIELTWVPATWPGIHARLLAEEWHVLHFIGHGDYDPIDDEGALALVGDDGWADRVEAGRLADLLAEAQPMPRLVVLNSCSSGQSGTNDLFSGTASALVRSGISAVAAMQFAISDAAAVAFARGFYTAIAHGRSIDEAARSGRISILGAPRSLEWVTPVLYVRGHSSQLFTLAAETPAPRERPSGPDSPPAPAKPVPGPAGRSQAQLRALYVAARAELRVGHFEAAIGLFDDLLTLDPSYSDAAKLRDTARRNAQLAEDYARARAAEDRGDWADAARCYGQLLQIDPGYQDAAARQVACQTQQQVSDLQAELRYHADARQWQAVLDTSAELASLDPATADPDGLATAARASLDAEQQVAGLEVQLRGHYLARRWQAVLNINAELIRVAPGWDDPEGLVTRTRRNLAAEQHADRQELEQRYVKARAAEGEGNWAVAINWYSQVLQIDPEYRDAAERQAVCQASQRVDDLDAQLRGHFHAGQWQAVILASTELARVAPGWDDPEGLVTAARRNLAAEANARARQEPAASLKPLHRIVPASSAVRAVCWHPAGGRIAVTTFLHKVLVFDLSGDEPKKLFALKIGNMFVHAPAIMFSHDGTRLITGLDNKRIRIWDLASKRELTEIRTGKYVWSVALSPDGMRLAAPGGEGVCIWDPANGERLLELTGVVGWGVAFSPDGTRLATGDNARSRVWDAVSGSKVLALNHDHNIDRSPGDISTCVRSVAFNPDGTRLATGGDDATARIWNAANGQELLTLRHNGSVWSVAFSPDGTRLATGDNRTARISSAIDGQKLAEMPHDNKVRSVAFSPDGTRLATGCEDGSVQIWPVPGT